MYKPTVTDADLARLQAERDRADRLYNDALTDLDRALAAPGPLPAGAVPGPSPLDRLDSLWQVIPAEPVPFSGWRGKLAAFVWRLVGPMLQRQQEFNGALVEQARREAAHAAASFEAASALSRDLRREFEALAALHARLITYLQQITLYVDTKDRYETGLLWHELRRRTEGLSAGLSALGDELLKSREHVFAHERRLETRLAEGLALVTSRAALLAGREAPAVHAGGQERPPHPSPERVAEAQLAGADSASAYAGFEDLYRGGIEEIRERIGQYLPLFAGASDVVDLGCGRGEFLLALKENAITARGVDINPEMVARCTAQGLDVVEGEALHFLAAAANASLGGIFAAQVVEHLEPASLLRLLDLARAKLRPGGRLVLETVNPACWAAFFSSYIRDITHVRPIHPDTLRYLLVARGFRNVDIRFSSPYPREAKLKPLPPALLSAGAEMAAVVEEFNRNVEILNGQMFTYLDYAAVAENV